MDTRMTGPREAGVLLGQARSRDARRASMREDDILALERIADALEGLEVSFAVIADIVEAQAYVSDELDHDDDEFDEETDILGCA
jgi:hypothetical protein